MLHFYQPVLALPYVCCMMWSSSIFLCTKAPVRFNCVQYIFIHDAISFHLPMVRTKIFIIQLTLDNSNLQGKSEKVQVIGSSKYIARIKGKTSFYCTMNILNTFNCRNVK